MKVASYYSVMLISICLTCCFAEVSRAQDSPPVEAKKGESVKDVHNLRPKLPTPELLKNSEKAILDGFDYLVRTQNEDGSWGSHDPKVANMANFGFQLRNRGSQDAVRIACTAICAEALLEQDELSEPHQKALDKAIQLLIKSPAVDPKTGIRPAEFAFHPGESFNTWGYGYKLGFLTRLFEKPQGEKFKDEIKQAAQCCIDSLLRHQQHNGGWHYYGNQMKNQGAMSFNTSFFGLSLLRAQAMDLKLPEGMVNDAGRAVEKQRVPDGSFVYDSRFINSNGGHHLENLGSASRTISNTIALFKMGYYSRVDLEAAMKIFDNGENYLEMGRKRIVPHSVVHQISGYFFFFGYNYATQTAEILGNDIPQKRWDRFSWTMLRTQEKNGSWWDTPAADYGDKWGTGFAIQCLQRYVRETKRRMNSTEPSEKIPSETDSKELDSEQSDSNVEKADPTDNQDSDK